MLCKLLYKQLLHFFDTEKKQDKCFIRQMFHKQKEADFVLLFIFTLELWTNSKIMAVTNLHIYCSIGGWTFEMCIISLHNHFKSAIKLLNKQKWIVGNTCLTKTTIKCKWTFIFFCNVSTLCLKCYLMLLKRAKDLIIFLL